jgi:hypothetical protein
MERGTELAEVEFYWTTRRYNPEDSTVYTHRCENLKFSIILLLVMRFS